ncbi:hypothetical protein [Pseudoalteromonas aurantia]|uniref:Integrase SAM-like N-terminal domain-containing protein n=1 Tax=Pseudoalteromonas aurantia TaxID=43654 RepID=A0ABY2VSB7_9GAMM|nr:hypothetical protein [Pseudoalteromonas aurantia]TMO69875.1 hypothetical protein CWC20_20315 [Pseudoalteromonas aurantia]
MGIRSTLKKELMNLDATDLMTADDVRNYLKLHFARVKNKSVQSFNLISHFNEYHSQVVSGAPTKKVTLNYTRHRLFKDVLYPKKSVQQWAKQHDLDG